MRPANIQEWTNPSSQIMRDANLLLLGPPLLALMSPTTTSMNQARNKHECARDKIIQISLYNLKRKTSTKMLEIMSRPTIKKGLHQNPLHNRHMQPTISTSGLHAPSSSLTRSTTNCASTCMSYRWSPFHNRLLDGSKIKQIASIFGQFSGSNFCFDSCLFSGLFFFFSQIQHLGVLIPIIVEARSKNHLNSVLRAQFHVTFPYQTIIPNSSNPQPIYISVAF